jgi:hypothetical protein
MVIINAYVQLTDPAYQNIPIRDRLKGIVEGVFRVLDTNGNGLIESFELSEIVSDVITGVASILTALLDYMESELLKVNRFHSPSHPLLSVHLLHSHLSTLRVPNNDMLHGPSHALRIRRPQEPLDGIVSIYADKLLEQTGEEPFPVAKIVGFNLSAVPDSASVLPSDEELAANWTTLESTLGPLLGRRELGETGRGREREKERGG